MTPLRLFGWTITLFVHGGTAGHFTAGSAREAITWFTSMAIGIVIGLWLGQVSRGR